MKLPWDIIVLGGGAAGLMAAAVASARGRRVVVLERTDAVGAKILISGGGRCNFTNLDIRPERFLSANPPFVRSALSRFTQHDFIALVAKHRIPFYEKTLGQLFCEGAGSAKRIVRLLLDEASKAEIRTGIAVKSVTKGAAFRVETSAGLFEAEALILATGGLSIPKLGATDFAFRLAAQFGLPVIPPRPALVPLVSGAEDRNWMAPLSGLSVDAVALCRGAAFREGLLFTHRGLSGPSILQISSYWRPGDALLVDLWPAGAAGDALTDAKRAHPKALAKTALASLVPERLADILSERFGVAGRRMGELKDKDLHAFGDRLKSLSLTPTGDEGYAKAEVTAGGVDTAVLDQKTMQVRAVPGLYIVGEAVDVTGWLGGYNFQWAWSSGWAAGSAV